MAYFRSVVCFFVSRVVPGTIDGYLWGTWETFKIRSYLRQAAGFRLIGIRKGRDFVVVGFSS